MHALSALFNLGGVIARSLLQMVNKKDNYANAAVLHRALHFFLIGIKLFEDDWSSAKYCEIFETLNEELTRDNNERMDASTIAFE
ncbi:hypothetical protein X798_04581 [Onchocerca flexuosa]|uniref:Uncharacterized protein n=2 Tax=Onchocerca flexuosa TaxID=387005 RepID=A0A183HYG7_9BILA|nr:hypothetical protein X798_04581 [Onchocerca flexuosa]VDP11524.1 unnamed protein product [Onchocerca flexuosa]